MTTAVGLAIAIPLLGLYHYFKSRTISMSTEIEEQLLHLADRWIPPRGSRRSGVDAADAGRPKEVAVV